MSAPVFRGADARVTIHALLLMIPATLASIGAIAAELGTPMQIVAAVPLLLLLALAFAGLFKKVPARVTVYENKALLRGLFFRRAVDLPCELETGSLVESVPDVTSASSDYNTPGRKVKAGSYVRLHHGDAEMIVGTRTKAQPDGVEKGPKRSSWDIELPRDAFQAFVAAVRAENR